jgi:deoxycytidylate deaminase
MNEFRKLVPHLCRKGTAAGGGKGWTPDNPTWGHCAVVSLIAQNLFGGELLRISLEGTEFAEYRSHYFNQLPDGSVEDITKDQFSGRLPEILFEMAVVKDRGDVINGADTKDRYVELAFRLAERLNENDPLFEDIFYRTCIREALKSPCQKMGKGAVITDETGKILFADHNRFVEGLEHLCAEKCIRFDIASRTDSMVGSCGHAEEVLLIQSAKAGYDLSSLHVYVATVGPDGMPHNERPRPEFTCLRCAVQMVNAGLGSVNIVSDGQWHRQTPVEAVKSSAAYALGEKKI